MGDDCCCCCCCCFRIFFFRICSLERTPGGATQASAEVPELGRGRPGPAPSPGLTLLPHPCLLAFPQPALLALAPHERVHLAGATAPAGVAPGPSSDHTSAEEALAAFTAEHVVVEARGCVSKRQTVTPLGLDLNLLFSRDIRVAVPFPGGTIEEVSLFSWHLVGSGHGTPSSRGTEVSFHASRVFLPSQKHPQRHSR